MELVSHNPLRLEALLLQEFPKEPPGGFAGLAGLYEEIKYFSLVIDGTLKPVTPATDLDDHFVQMPSWTMLRS